MNKQTTATAYFSPCREYRYALIRVWDETKPRVLFIMLNPSKAGEAEDDNTITRCTNFAKDWGYGGLYVVNLFARISTDPKELLTAPFVVGVENEKWIRRMSALSEIAVCAWGNSPIVSKLQKRLDPAYKPLSWVTCPLHYLRLANDGTPWHPLYLPKTLKPIPYTMPQKTTLS